MSEHPQPHGWSWPARDERGFVMVMVVFLLFAVTVLGATGYQLVATEPPLPLARKSLPWH